MYGFLTRVLGEKKEWKEMEARARALPRDHRALYTEVKSYVFKFADGDGSDAIATLRDVLVALEAGPADGRTALEVTGPDVAAFCDARIRSGATWADRWRADLNSAVAAKVAD